MITTAAVSKNSQPIAKIFDLRNELLIIILLLCLRKWSPISSTLLHVNHNQLRLCDAEFDQKFIYLFPVFWT